MECLLNEPFVTGFCCGGNAIGAPNAARVLKLGYDVPEYTHCIVAKLSCVLREGLEGILGSLQSLPITPVRGKLAVKYCVGSEFSVVLVSKYWSCTSRLQIGDHFCPISSIACTFNLVLLCLNS